jgi:hypothetical protein
LWFRREIFFSVMPHLLKGRPFAAYWGSPVGGILRNVTILAGVVLAVVTAGGECASAATIIAASRRSQLSDGLGVPDSSCGSVVGLQT